MRYLSTARINADAGGSPSSGDLTNIAATTRHGFTEHEHLDKLKIAREQLGAMERRLAELKGKKAIDALRQDIKDPRDQIKGHEKEIRQKWPELGTDF